MNYDDGTYVSDRDGVIWLVVRDGGMVTRADYTGAHSAGIAWLEEHAGPLQVLSIDERHAVMTHHLPARCSVEMCGCPDVRCVCGHSLAVHS